MKLCSSDGKCGDAKSYQYVKPAELILEISSSDKIHEEQIQAVVLSILKKGYNMTYRTKYIKARNSGTLNLTLRTSDKKIIKIFSDENHQDILSMEEIKKITQQIEGNLD